MPNSFDLAVFRRERDSRVGPEFTNFAPGSRLISNALFAVDVAAVVFILLGGTTWLSGGFWAADGAYSRFVSLIMSFKVEHKPTFEIASA